MGKKKICVITGTRADYGLLFPLIEKLKRSRKFELQIVATCMHLSSEFGMTYEQIEQDGFTIDKKVEMLLSSDTPGAICKSTGLGLMGISDALTELKPDFTVILGDRFEALAAATASLMHSIPIIHIHGGEITEGAVDDSIRHAITKMSYIHFTTTEAYLRRVIQLGEDPSKVFNVGALGIDNIVGLKPLSRNALQKRLGVKFAKRNIMVTFHPVTLEGDTSAKQFGEVLKALDKLKDTHIIFTKCNADAHGRVIISMMEDFVSKNKKRSAAFNSLGQHLYLNTLKHSDVILGNSSSALLEAPTLRMASINIGDRQKGRITADSVIHCKPTQKEISKALQRALSDEFKKILKETVNPYGNGGTAQKIMKVLNNLTSKRVDLKKRFYDYS